MCLAVPALVIKLLGHDSVIVDLAGVRKTVSIALVPEARIGDYVIVHVGHAIGILNIDEANATLALFAQLTKSAT